VALPASLGSQRRRERSCWPNGFKLIHLGLRSGGRPIWLSSWCQVCAFVATPLAVSPSQAVESNLLQQSCKLSCSKRIKRSSPAGRSGFQFESRMLQPRRARPAPSLSPRAAASLSAQTRELDARSSKPSRLGQPTFDLACTHPLEPIDPQCCCSTPRRRRSVCRPRGVRVSL